MKLGCNLFKFAPRELSHSAFWAWVVDSLNSTSSELSDVRQLGSRLLSGLGTSIPGQIKVETEYQLSDSGHRIDIYVKLDGREVVLIENKVSDRPSVQQLRAYKDAVGEVENVYCLLISTAYPMQEARCAEEEEGWTCRFAEDVLKLLRGINREHPVLVDYHSWLSREYAKRRDWEEKARGSDPDDRAAGLQTVPGQWKFMERVTEPFSDQGRRYGHRDRSGGNHATEFRFVELKGEQQDAVFYRVEKLASGPVFRVHQYQEPPKPDLATKKERLRQLREFWRKSVEEVGELPWDQKNPGCKYRCEIARIGLLDHGAEELAEELANVHGVFTQKLRDWGLDVEKTWNCREVEAGRSLD